MTLLVINNEYDNEYGNTPDDKTVNERRNDNISNEHKKENSTTEHGNGSITHDKKHWFNKNETKSLNFIYKRTK